MAALRTKFLIWLYFVLTFTALQLNRLTAVRAEFHTGFHRFSAIRASRRHRMSAFTACVALRIIIFTALGTRVIRVPALWTKLVTFLNVRITFRTARLSSLFRAFCLV